MLPALLTVIKLYEKRGFIITEIKADIEFQCLEHDLLPIVLNTFSQDDHVGEIERSNRTVKNDLRTLTHSLPYLRFPRVMIVDAVRFVVRSRN